MSTKNKVLELLIEKGNRYTSGQQMAEELFVTRAAIWKAVKSLQNEGYPIEAVTNRGYRLINTYSLPEVNRIEEYIKTHCENVAIDNIDICVYDKVTSTNDVIRSMTSSDVAVVIAGSQTAGRGRRGRTFFSPEGTGIYMSLLIHPDLPMQKATGLTCIMAVAICRAIEKVVCKDTQIKWVNDIFYNGKKVAGILTEAVTSIEDGDLSYVIMGAGINLYEPFDGFPTEIKNSAGALLDSQMESSLGSDLCGAIIASFFEIYNSGSKEYINEYRNRSMLIGNYVKVMQYQNENDRAGNSYAYVEGIDDDCHLVVRYDDDKVEHLSTGEVSVIKY